MEWGKHIIISSDKDWDIHIVSWEDLCWLINEIFSVIKVIVNVILNFIEISVRSPTVSIHNSNENVFWADHQSFEFFFHSFNTPWDIWSFSFLFEFSNNMSCEIYVSEFILKSGDQLLSLNIAFFLMLFHC